MNDQEINFPVVIRDSEWKKRLVLSKNSDLCITKYNSQQVYSLGYDKLIDGAEQIPITDFLNELESLIADVRRAHGLNHVASVHEMGIGCRICSAEFSDEYALEAHMNFNHK